MYRIAMPRINTKKKRIRTHAQRKRERAATCEITMRRVHSAGETLNKSRVSSEICDITHRFSHSFFSKFLNSPPRRVFQKISNVVLRTVREKDFRAGYDNKTDIIKRRNTGDQYSAYYVLTFSAQC